MRILSIGNFSGPSWDGSLPDEEHIASALESLGHEVVRWQREIPLNPKLAWLHEDYDFTLIAQWDGYNHVIDLLPKPLVYWAFDYQADGQEWHERLVAEADLYLSKRIADNKYPNWRWLSQDFAPEILRKNPEFHPIDIDVLFTGSYLPWASERNATLKAVDDKFNLVIHSVTPDQWVAEGFKNVFGPVMDEGLLALVSRAKINLSIDHTLEAGYWSDRNAQVMVCGGFVLFRYIPLSETVFRDNIDYFYGVEDCLERIAYWLEPKHDQERLNLAQKGHTFATYNLMDRNRVNDLLTIVRSILCVG